MGWLWIWCSVAGLLTWLTPKALRAAHFRGLPEEARSFFERLQQVLIRQHPGVDLVGITSEGFGAVLRVERQELAVPLGEVFLRERAFPDAFPKTVDRLVTEIRDHLATIHDLPFDEAIPKILPQIRPQEWVRASSPAFGPGRLVTTPLLNDLLTCYVLDEPGSMVFVTHGHLDEWGCKSEYIANLALTNLKRLAETEGGLPVPAAADREPCVLHTGDGYDAARMLLATDPCSVDDVQGLVFAIPDRDTLVVARTGSGLGRLMAEVGAEYEQSAHRISPRLFEIADGSLRPVEPTE
jgi:uncharacterized protein YtpQ (UPF0354 family)